MVTDLRHYLDMLDDAPAPARRLGTHFAAIVRAASARPAGSGWRSVVGCTLRHGHRRCEGFIIVFRHLDGEIAWGCDSCGDEGVIRGWEGLPTDVSRLADSYADGDAVSLLISRDVSDLLRDVLLMGDACELLVARAEGSSAGVLLIGSASSFEELFEYVLSEANSETNRARERRLDEVCDSLEAALAG